MAAAVEMFQVDEKVLAFLKNIIQHFWRICGSGGVEYKHRRLVFLRNIVLEFDKILDEMGRLGVESSYCTWLSSCIIHIRDVRFGYGIRDIAYALLVVWYRRYPDEADLVMRRFVSDVGCWSDIKRFLGLWRELGGEGEGGVVGRVVAIMIDQLWLDHGVWNRVFGEYMKKLDDGLGPCSRPRAGDYISNAAKWVPREKSKYGWLYDYFVIAWGAKACWRRGGGGSMDRWRKDFRKVVSGLCRELQPDFMSEKLEAKDFARMAYEGRLGFEGEAGWRKVLDRFCSVCELAIDTIPVVDLQFGFRLPSVVVSQIPPMLWTSVLRIVQYYDFGTDDFWRAISYAILIAQRGNIGRFMLGDNWIVSRREDHLSDIVARIRRVVGGGVDRGCSQNTIEMLMEASEVSGYEYRDKLFYIGCINNINI